MIETAVKRETESWARCIAVTTVLVGVSDLVQSYILFAAFRSSDFPSSGASRDSAVVECR